MASWNPISEITDGGSWKSWQVTTHGGKAYLVFARRYGGIGNGAQVRCYDPGTDTYTSLAIAPSWTAFGASATIGNLWYHFGGYGQPSSGAASTDTRVYDLVGDTWTSLAAMPQAAGDIAAVALGTKIYVFGGFNDPDPGSHDWVQIYDTVGNSWSTGTAIPTPLGDLAAATDGTYIYLFGGTGPSPTFVDQTTIYRYDPTGNSWSTVGSLWLRSQGQLFTTTASGYVVLAGGYLGEAADGSGGGDSLSVGLWRLSDGGAYHDTPLPAGTYYFGGLAEISGTLYVFNNAFANRSASLVLDPQPLWPDGSSSSSGGTTATYTLHADLDVGSSSANYQVFVNGSIVHNGLADSGTFSSLTLTQNITSGFSFPAKVEFTVLSTPGEPYPQLTVDRCYILGLSVDSITTYYEYSFPAGHYPKNFDMSNSDPSDPFYHNHVASAGTISLNGYGTNGNTVVSRQVDWSDISTSVVPSVSQGGKLTLFYGYDPIVLPTSSSKTQICLKDEILTDSPETFYKFSETEYRTTQDISGHNNTGTYIPTEGPWADISGGTYDVFQLSSQGVTNNPLTVFSEPFPGFDFGSPGIPTTFVTLFFTAPSSDWPLTGSMVFVALLTESAIISAPAGWNYLVNDGNRIIAYTKYSPSINLTFTFSSASFWDGYQWIISNGDSISNIIRTSGSVTPEFTTTEPNESAFFVTLSAGAVTGDPFGVSAVPDGWFAFRPPGSQSLSGTFTGAQLRGRIAGTHPSRAIVGSYDEGILFTVKSTVKYVGTEFAQTFPPAGDLQGFSTAVGQLDISLGPDTKLSDGFGDYPAASCYPTYFPGTGTELQILGAGAKYEGADGAGGRSTIAFSDNFYGGTPDLRIVLNVLHYGMVASINYLETEYTLDKITVGMTASPVGNTARSTSILCLNANLGFPPYAPAGRVGAVNPLVSTTLYRGEIVTPVISPLPTPYAVTAFQAVFRDPLSNADPVLDSNSTSSSSPICQFGCSDTIRAITFARPAYDGNLAFSNGRATLDFPVNYHGGAFTMEYMLNVAHSTFDFSHSQTFSDGVEWHVASNVDDISKTLIGRNVGERAPIQPGWHHIAFSVDKFGVTIYVVDGAIVRYALGGSLFTSGNQTFQLIASDGSQLAMLAFYNSRVQLSRIAAHAVHLCPPETRGIASVFNKSATLRTDPIQVTIDQRKTK